MKSKGQRRRTSDNFDQENLRVRLGCEKKNYLILHSFSPLIWTPDTLTPFIHLMHVIL